MVWILSSDIAWIVPIAQVDIGRMVLTFEWHLPMVWMWLRIPLRLPMRARVVTHSLIVGALNMTLSWTFLDLPWFYPSSERNCYLSSSRGRTSCQPIDPSRWHLPGLSISVMEVGTVIHSRKMKSCLQSSFAILQFNPCSVQVASIAGEIVKHRRWALTRRYFYRSFSTDWLNALNFIDLIPDRLGQDISSWLSSRQTSSLSSVIVQSLRHSIFLLKSVMRDKHQAGCCHV